ncbi:MAG TPA: c-type cytochrome biogenesis protein CcsB [Deltaproteobacteria bacterium]|nr:c-type cytochrome biogenesis protein CcsB [Deltaproteobacteria bacterium]
MNITVLNSVPLLYLAGFAFGALLSVTGGILLERARSVMLFAGFSLHTAGILIRWIESYALAIGHAPLANLYESLVFFSWAIVFFFLVLNSLRKIEGLSTLILLFAAGLMAWASLAPAIDPRIQPLIPALKSNWLISHVTTCFLGYASFVIAAIFGAWLLLPGSHRNPGRDTLEERIYQCCVIGFIFFTIGIMTGSVWAHYAWGRYWGWDPKETWALITWLIYAAALHTRFLPDRGGKRFAVLTLIGLASIMFTFLGVNYLPGLHSYL